MILHLRGEANPSIKQPAINSNLKQSITIINMSPLTRFISKCTVLNAVEHSLLWLSCLSLLWLSCLSLLRLSCLSLLWLSCLSLLWLSYLSLVWLSCLSLLWLSCLSHLVLLLTKTFKLFSSSYEGGK